MNPQTTPVRDHGLRTDGRQAMTARILVLDDDQEMCELLRLGLSKLGYVVETFTKPAEAITALATEGDVYDAVITDMDLHDEQTGLHICEHLAHHRPEVPVIVITAFGTMDSAVGAIRAGAYDFINKPVSLEPLVFRLRRALQARRLHIEVRRLRDEVAPPRSLQDIVGSSPAMKRMLDVVARIGPVDASILLTGESGTGKELVAQALHQMSARKDRPFVAINCAAVPESLLQSELFGHVRGAFTDAKSNRRGLFQEAEGGTLLLDEVAEMPLEMQAKILRALQERKVRPVGGDSDVPFECRIIAATNRDLEADVASGRFRQDLYYRINVVHVDIPPLRARNGDILILGQHFLRAAAERMHKHVVGISPEAASKLLEYPWPGNVRELQSCMERAVALTRFETLTVDDMPERVRRRKSVDIGFSVEQSDEVPTLSEVERRYIQKVLKMTGGNKAHAARVLGLDRRTLYRRLDDRRPDDERQEDPKEPPGAA